MHGQQWMSMAGGLSLFLSGMVVAAPTKKVAKPLQETPAETPVSVFFPDWNPEGFDWNIGPIAGFRARQTDVDGVRTDVISSEFGLGARVYGIPLAPGNPGLTVQPYGSYTWGNRSEKVKDADLRTTESTGYQRSWYGAVGRAYYRAFRYSLDIGQGQILHDKDAFVDINSRRIQNDFGLMILPFFSAHYTLTWLTVSESGEDKPGIEELDHWLHGRVAFSLFNMNLDVGPGMSRTEYSGRTAADQPFEKIATVESVYMKALTSMHIFWKLGASGSAKYIIHADQDEGLQDGIEQLPYEGLTQRKSLAALPDGSLEASAFFGLRDLFAGFGVGWQYYYLEQKGNPKEISRNSGFGLVYSMDI
jgi:hypothetical protein